ncbi:TIGR02281 family clan AA aspartic protease [Oxalobacteraceae bacterium OM1]|nr:TIGR02281 family clan AA aspartic protease [Oxalobacteraceae bacterium OM1]
MSLSVHVRVVWLAGSIALGAAAHAADITVVGLFQNKAVLVVDGAPPKTYAAGSTVAPGVRLIAVNEAGAIIESNGRHEAFSLGEHVNRNAPSGRASVTLSADPQGHYFVQGQINGGSARMLLDTGATLIALPASEAERLGINYRSGRLLYLNTANGQVQAYRVMLNSVRVGDLELNQVEAVVQDSGLPVILLGNSFLNRTEMRREGVQMVLSKRF